VPFADEVKLRGDHPGSKTVKKGDTLWDIAGQFLTQPWQWPEIWENNQQISNPHLIYPGDQIALTYRDGRPILGFVGNRYVKLSPSIRETKHKEAIHPIPLDAIQQFLSRPRVVTKDELGKSAYIVGSQDEHLTFGSGHRVYAPKLGEPSTNKFSIYRQGGAYIDPDNNQILGYQAEHVGDALAERFGDPATLHIVKATKEVMKGDRLLPQERDEIPEFVPHAPAGDVNGKIIEVLNGVSQIGQHQVVVLNRGDNAGLEPGHVLAIYQDGEVIEDIVGSEIAVRQQVEPNQRAEHENPRAIGRMRQSMVNELQAADYARRDFVGTPVEGRASVLVQLPAERAGELMVFRTFDNVSYALVMNTQRTIHINDSVTNP